MIKPKMTWVSGRKGWLKKHKGEMHAVSCRQLDAPPNKQESTKAANDWWDKKLATIESKPSRFPGLDHLELERNWYTFTGETDLAVAAANEIERYKQLAEAGKLDGRNCGSAYQRANILPFGQIVGGSSRRSEPSLGNGLVSR